MLNAMCAQATDKGYIEVIGAQGASLESGVLVGDQVGLIYNTYYNTLIQT